MNIDDLVWIALDKEWLQDLHIACQDQEVHFVLDEIKDALLVHFARILCDGKMVVRYVIHTSERLQLLMIADNKGNIHRQFAALPAPQQIDQAMIELGDKYPCSLALARVRQAPFHAKALSDGTKCACKLWWLEGKPGLVEIDTHEEGTIFLIGGVLIGLQNISMMLEDEI